jgi:uncharacterized protein (TIGR03790 family)
VRIMSPAVLILLVCCVAFGADRTTIKKLTVTPGANSAKVAWDATEARGISGWAVEWSTFSSLPGRVSWTVTAKPGAREATITGLKPGRNYSVRVYPFTRARKTARRAPVSGPSSTTVRVGTPAAALGAPAGVVAVADDSRVRVSWQPSAALNVAGYEIARKAPGDEANKPYLKLTLGTRTPRLEKLDGGGNLRAAGVATIVDTGVEAGKAYEYAVRSFTSDAPAKYSPYSKTVTVRTDPFVLTGDNVLFVVNTAHKPARTIAVNYARARGITKPKAVKISIPWSTEIDRAVFEKSVLAPVKAALARRPQVTVLILVRGISIRIRENSRNPVRYHGWTRGAVDSDLALARLDDVSPEGRLRNPLYGKTTPLTPVDQILGVCRLDGPDDRIANMLVRRAMAAEQRGVEGIAFFDTGGPYPSGDRPILAAAQMVEKDGRMTVKVDKGKNVVDLSTLKQKIGFYYGWYAGHFRARNPAFRFGRGAVGVHLHSFAAYKMDAKKQWVGPMLAHGVTATLGPVDEPLLDGFPTADALVKALLAGRTFAEASLYANRYLSWMSVHYGDPLYRPFKAKAPVVP